MKNRIIAISLFSIVLCSLFCVGCMNTENNQAVVPDQSDMAKEKVEPTGEKISLYNFNDQLMFSLDELSSSHDIKYEYDTFEGTINITLDNSIYYMLRNTSVVAKDGVYIPNTFKPYIDEEGKIFLNVKMLDNIFSIDYKSATDEKVIEVFANENTNIAQNSENVNFEKKFPSMTEEDMANYLAFLSLPIEGAHITTKDSQMPGAPRTYRNGTHEGIDWYSGYTGVHVDKKTPILSMADGVVVRADKNYVELTHEERGVMLETAKNSDHTSQDTLDKLRGRTVWVQYDKGIMVRYAHMDKISETIEVGKSVKRGEVLGYVGNTGTSYSLNGNDLGLHLHSDILIYNHLFWENFTFEQTRNILEILFP